MSVPDGHPFALCLTHDVDRPHKSLAQALFYAARERRLDHLWRHARGANPYWQFGEVAALEDELGVRSAFYVLDEPHLLADRGPRAWLRPTNWVQHLGRYDVAGRDVAAALRRLDADGWEVGLHGSYHSSDDRARLAREKRALEAVLGHPVRGARQHYLRLAVPDTWRHHAAVGLSYDASLGSSVDYGFRHGYDVLRPFDDAFVVFPLTLMEATLPDPGRSFDAAWAACEGLLEEAAEHGAVMTVLWHLRYFSETDFPGYRRLYRRLVERALAAGAWVGPPGALYDRLDHDAAIDHDAATATARPAPDGDPAGAPSGSTAAGPGG